MKILLRLPLPLICITLFVGIICIYRVQDVPAGFFIDEAIRGLDAFYLLRSGHDSNGDLLPLFPKVSGEYAPPIQTYSEMLFIALFGLNETAVRLTSVAYGIASIVAIYFLAKELFSERVGLFAAFILAITPWFVHYSRTGFEYSAYLAFFLASLFFWVKGLKEPKFFFISLTFWALTLYTYNPAKLIVPVFVVALVVICRKTVLLHKHVILQSLILFSLLATPVVLHLYSGEGLVRFNQISLFSQDKPHQELLILAAKNYLYHFSPNFLFFKGDPTFLTRHFTNGLTPLLIFAMPFIILGIISLFRKPYTKGVSTRIMLFWLIAYPLGGTFTQEIGTNRAMIGVALFAILQALGVEFLIRNIHKHTLRFLVQSLIVVGFVISFTFFYRFYHSVYPRLSSDFWGWQYGPRETMRYFLVHKAEYDDLYMSGEFNGAHIFLQFYDPEGVCSNKCKIGDFYRDSIYTPQRQQLFSLSPDYLSKSTFANRFHTKQTIYYPNGTVAFVIGTVVE